MTSALPLSQRPPSFPLSHGRRHRVRVALGLYERSTVTNESIREEYELEGFYDVRVHGDGGTRFVEARWPGRTEERPLPRAEALEEIPG